MILHRYFRYLIGAVAALLTLTAVYLSVLINQRQDALSVASLYDRSWIAAQASVELSRLGQSIGATSQPISNQRDIPRPSIDK